MNYLNLVIAALGAALTQSLSFRLGNYTVTAVDANSGAPVHFTFAAALSAGEAILAGKTGTVQVGDIMISISAN